MNQINYIFFVFVKFIISDIAANFIVYRLIHCHNNFLSK